MLHVYVHVQRLLKFVSENASEAISGSLKCKKFPGRSPLEIVCFAHGKMALPLVLLHDIVLGKLVKGTVHCIKINVVSCGSVCRRNALLNIGIIC